MIKDAVSIGVQMFLGSAVFVGCWVLLVMLLALVARILGGKADDEEADE